MKALFNHGRLLSRGIRPASSVRVLSVFCPRRRYNGVRRGRVGPRLDLRVSRYFRAERLCGVIPRVRGDRPRRSSDDLLTGAADEHTQEDALA